MKKTVQQKKRRAYIRYGIYAGVAVLFAILLYTQRANFSASVRAISRADPGYVVAACLVMTMSVICSAGVYRQLATVPLRYAQTVLVLFAGLFMNKLLPAGSGALGVSFLYLRARGMAAAQTGAVLVLNNLIGFAGHLTLLLLAFVFHGDAANVPTGAQLSFLRHWQTGVLFVAVLAIVLVGLWLWQKSRFMKSFHALKPVLGRPMHLVIALLWSVGITLCYAVCVWATAAAVGVDLTAVQALLVLTLSVFAMSVVPTPGGIGAAEAGIFLALRGYDVSPDKALAAALLYRFVTFWIPLMLGGLAFLIVSKRKFLDSSKV